MRTKRKASRISSVKTHQLNTKLTNEMYDQLQSVNDKLFNGELNNTDLGLFLFQVALDYLAKAKVETKQVVMVDGLPLEVK